jgi:DNA invertase Pin-like site-specific DNA recombinase
MRLGYRRAIAVDGTLEVQRLALLAAGCELLFEDLGISGIDPNKPGLERLLGALQPGDVLVVWSLDRLVRDFTDMLEVLAKALLAGARVVSLHDDLDSDRMGSGELTRVVKALLSHKDNVEAERALAERQRRLDALRGPGRPQSVSGAQWDRAKDGFEAGETFVSRVVGQVGVSRAALYRRRDAEEASTRGGAASP